MAGFCAEYAAYQCDLLLVASRIFECGTKRSDLLVVCKLNMVCPYTHRARTVFEINFDCNSQVF